MRARKKLYLTDARSVFDYVTKDTNALSRDKRMAIEGALLKETMQQENCELRWIDGTQNLSDILTKDGADLEFFRVCLRTNLLAITQDPRAAAHKKQKAAQRANRKQATAEHTEAQRESRRAQQAARLQAAGPATADDG